MTGVSPMLLGLKQRFRRVRSQDQKPVYEPFTTAFDEVVDAADLPRLLPALSGDHARGFDEAVRAFDLGFQAERVEIAEEAARLVRDIRAALGEGARAQTAISFLIDHSGSMRGLRMLSALIAVQAAVDALAQAGIAREVLGFTTAGWKGGRSRRAWRWAGRPANPGRLCDLRHIVYAAAGDAESTFPWRLRLMLRPDLLHENIDGEALEWASARLENGSWRSRIILVLSDGAPVDDSTLLANADPHLLTRHLQASEERLVAGGVTVGFLLIGNEHVREPRLHERGAEPLSCGLGLLALVRRALMVE